MLEPQLAQIGELVELNDRLTSLRLEIIRNAQANRGSAQWSNEAEARTRQIAERARAHHSGAEWLARFPYGAEETDPILSGIMMSSRDIAMETCVRLHRLIMETPVVGCGDDES